MSIRYLLKIKPAVKPVYNPNREYTCESGYTMLHDKYWKVFYRGRQVFSAADKNFQEIIALFKWYPWDVREKSDNEKLSDWIPEEEDHNFIPSLGRDYESGVSGYKTLIHIIDPYRITG